MADGGSGEPGAGGGSAPVCSFVRKRPKYIPKRPAAPAGSDDGGATATLETEHDRDARAIRERQLKQAEESHRREHTVSSLKAGSSHSPRRASSHIRVNQQFDYQPEICKDYKETGFCGYGDSCNFIHDRGD